MGAPAIEACELRKSFGDTAALQGVSLAVDAGAIVGLLGPNGAGKTTTIHCLTTLLTPDDGTASVAGHDVVREPAAVRASIAVTGQFAAVDPLISGRQNLVLFGRLLGLRRAEARRRAAELLERFDLEDAADRSVESYSGGMKRRLDLAASLVVERPVLFLDEPTTGLDPRSRHAMWNAVDDLRSRGTAILLTTQYLEEADRLADFVVLIEDGRVLAEGTPDDLKRQVGGDVCEVALADPDQAERARAALDGFSDVRQEGERVTVAAPEPRVLLDVARALDGAGVVPEDVSIRRPTLEEVFLAMTGSAAADDGGRFARRTAGAREAEEARR